MMRIVAAVVIAALFALPVAAAPIAPVVATGLVGVALAAAGLVFSWRWFTTAAACVFLVMYAVALSVAAAPINLIAAAGYGVGLLLLLQTGELARRLRGATVASAVISSMLGRWIGFGGAVFATAVAAMALAGGLAPSIPFAAAPFVAAGGAFGVVIALALLITRASGHAPDRRTSAAP